MNELKYGAALNLRGCLNKFGGFGGYGVQFGIYFCSGISYENDFYCPMGCMCAIKKIDRNEPVAFFVVVLEKVLPIITPILQL